MQDTSEQSVTKIYFFLVIANVLWGLNAIPAKLTVLELPPLTIAAMRFFFASVIFLGLILYIEGRQALPSRRLLPGIIGLGATGIFLNQFLFYTGVKYTTAINASLLPAANPAMTAVFASFILGDRLTAKQWAGIVVSFAGVGIIVTKGSWEIVRSLDFNKGDILLAIAPISWAIYSILGRLVMREISALAATAWASVVGTGLLIIAAFLQGFDGSVSLSPVGWASMIYMILGSGVLAFYLSNIGVSTLGPNRAVMFCNIIPLAGMIGAAVLLGEDIGFFQTVGALLVIAGVWLTVRG